MISIFQMCIYVILCNMTATDKFCSSITGGSIWSRVQRSRWCRRSGNLARWTVSCMSMLWYMLYDCVWTPLFNKNPYFHFPVLSNSASQATQRKVRPVFHGWFIHCVEHLPQGTEKTLQSSFLAWYFMFVYNVNHWCNEEVLSLFLTLLL